MKLRELLGLEADLVKYTKRIKQGCKILRKGLAFDQNEQALIDRMTDVLTTKGMTEKDFEDRYLTLRGFLFRIHGWYLSRCDFACADAIWRAYSGLSTYRAEIKRRAFRKGGAK